MPSTQATANAAAAAEDTAEGTASAMVHSSGRRRGREDEDESPRGSDRRRRVETTAPADASALNADASALNGTGATERYEPATRAREGDEADDRSARVRAMSDEDVGVLEYKLQDKWEELRDATTELTDAENRKDYERALEVKRRVDKLGDEAIDLRDALREATRKAARKRRTDAAAARMGANFGGDGEGPPVVIGGGLSDASEVAAAADRLWERRANEIMTRERLHDPQDTCFDIVRIGMALARKSGSPKITLRTSCVPVRAVDALLHLSSPEFFETCKSKGPREYPHRTAENPPPLDILLEHAKLLMARTNAKTIARALTASSDTSEQAAAHGGGWGAFRPSKDPLEGPGLAHSNGELSVRDYEDALKLALLYKVEEFGRESFVEGRNPENLNRSLGKHYGYEENEDGYDKEFCDHLGFGGYIDLMREYFQGGRITGGVENATRDYLPPRVDYELELDGLCVIPVGRRLSEDDARRFYDMSNALRDHLFGDEERTQPLEWGPTAIEESTMTPRERERSERERRYEQVSTVREMWSYSLCAMCHARGPNEIDRNVFVDYAGLFDGEDAHCFEDFERVWENAAARTHTLWRLSCLGYDVRASAGVRDDADGDPCDLLVVEAVGSGEGAPKKESFRAFAQRSFAALGLPPTLRSLERKRSKYESS